jgi:hypothetical protein
MPAPGEERPEKPDLRTVEVNFLGVLYSAFAFLLYLTCLLLYWDSMTVDTWANWLTGRRQTGHLLHPKERPQCRLLPRRDHLHGLQRRAVRLPRRACVLRDQARGGRAGAVDAAVSGPGGGSD